MWVNNNNNNNKVNNNDKVNDKEWQRVVTQMKMNERK